MPLSSQRGFTLLEVLVALLVFSLGLIGLAGLLTVSVKTNHSAYLRTQATFLAQGMADRMRANVLGLWNTNYDMALTTTPALPPAIPTTCDSPSVCTYAQVAARDLVVWQNQLATFLPASSSRINCVPGVAPSAAQLLSLPPYSGSCEIEIDWNDSSISGQATAYAEVFDWVFQP